MAGGSNPRPHCPVTTEQARRYTAKFDSSASAVQTHDLEAYFSPVSSSISLKLLTGAAGDTAITRVDAANEIPQVVSEFIKHLPRPKGTALMMI